jgi:hypothetical protein
MVSNNGDQRLKNVSIAVCLYLQKMAIMCSLSHFFPREVGRGAQEIGAHLLFNIIYIIGHFDGKGL